LLCTPALGWAGRIVAVTGVAKLCSQMRLNVIIRAVPKPQD
jgi:hypothetical protein